MKIAVLFFNEASFFYSHSNKMFDVFKFRNLEALREKEKWFYHSIEMSTILKERVIEHYCINIPF